MAKMQPPRINESKELQRVIDKIYKDLNLINEKLSSSKFSDPATDNKGDVGMVKIVDDGDKQYLEGKFKDGWKRVEVKSVEEEE